MEIRTYNECQTATTDLGMGWNGEKTNQHKAQRPYCWHGNAGRANYNGNGDYGPIWRNRGSSIICKRGTFWHFVAPKTP